MGVAMLPATLPNVVQPAPLRLSGQDPLLRSLSWERTVLSVLERVKRLPANLQGEIAARVGNYINLARTATDTAALTGFIEAAAAERAQIIEQMTKPTVDGPWATAALAEAWCIARLGLLNGSLNRYSAMSVMAAIEAFASENTRGSWRARDSNCSLRS